MTNRGHESVFGSLALRFAHSAEDLATEALAFILERSATAAKAFEDLIQLGVPGLSDLSYRTQDGTQDGGFVDLVGTDPNGVRVLLVEAKFWAGLTGNQPVAYLRALPANRNAALIILCPADRIPSLWHECRRLLDEAGVRMPTSRSVVGDYRVSKVAEQHVFGMLSWNTVLNRLQADLDAAGERDRADVRQLMGLAGKMDRESFLPLKQSELDPNVGRRVHQYAKMVDDVVRKLERDGFVSTKGLSTGGSQGSYGRFLHMADHYCFFHFSPRQWYRTADCPLWLNVKDNKWKTPPALFDRLRPFRDEPRRLFDYNGVPHIPVYPPTGVEYDRVVESLVHQIREVGTVLGDSFAAEGE